jgi:O-antigen ligase
MTQMKTKDNFGRIASLQAGLVALAITPGYSWDAFNAIKLVFLVAFGATGLLFVTLNFKSIKQDLNKITIVLFTILMVYSILIFFNSGNDLTQNLYGVAGRNTGFLAFISLFFVMFSATMASSSVVRSNIVTTLLICGFISVCYSLLQMSGNDFAGWSSSAGSPVIGFLGNPNFQSAFLSISATVGFAKLLDSSCKVLIRIISALLIVGSIIGLIGANATQGYIVLFLGLAVVSYLFARTNFSSKVPSRTILFGFIGGLIVGVLDILQRVPWNPFLYGETISFRGDFWRSGWQMTISNPFLGVGFDGFLNFDRRSRDLVAATRPAADTPTDAAHNVFLDYGSNGGIVFLLLNLLLVVFVALAGLRYMSKIKKYDSNFAAIFAAWLGYLAQAIVSINQIGLAVWGWLLGGLILGLQKNSLESTGSNSVISPPKNKKSNPSFGIAFALASLIGGLSAVPVLTADHSFKLAIESRNAKDFYDAALRWPKSTKTMILVTSVLIDNKIYKDALVLSKKTVEYNPDSFEAWLLYAANPLLSEKELITVKDELKRLDPNIEKLGGIDKYLVEKIPPLLS